VPACHAIITDVIIIRLLGRLLELSQAEEPMSNLSRARQGQQQMIKLQASRVLRHRQTHA